MFIQHTVFLLNKGSQESNYCYGLLMLVYDALITLKYHVQGWITIYKDEIQLQVKTKKNSTIQYKTIQLTVKFMGYSYIWEH